MLVANLGQQQQQREEEEEEQEKNKEEEEEEGSVVVLVVRCLMSEGRGCLLVERSTCCFRCEISSEFPSMNALVAVEPLRCLLTQKDQ
jgi:hypothetical protein